MGQERQRAPTLESIDYSLRTIKDPELREFALKVQESSGSLLDSILRKKGPDEKGLYISEIIDLVQCTFRELKREVPSVNQLNGYLGKSIPLVKTERENPRRRRMIGSMGTFFALCIYPYEREKEFSEGSNRGRKWNNINKIPRTIVFLRIQSALGEDHPLLASYIIPEEKPKTVTRRVNRIERGVQERDDHREGEEAFFGSVDDGVLAEILRNMEMEFSADNLFDTFSIGRMIDRGVVKYDSFWTAMLFGEIIRTVNRRRRLEGKRVSLNGIDEASSKEVFQYTRDFLLLMKELGFTNARDLSGYFLDMVEKARGVKVTPV